MCIPDVPKCCCQAISCTKRIFFRVFILAPQYPSNTYAVSRVLKCATALLYNSSNTSGVVAILMLFQSMCSAVSLPGLSTIQRSFGDRPVYFPVSTVNVGPYSACATTPSLFACSWSNNCGYVKLRYIVGIFVIPNCWSIPALAQASGPWKVRLTLYASRPVVSKRSGGSSSEGIAAVLWYRGCAVSVGRSNVITGKGVVQLRDAELTIVCEIGSEESRQPENVWARIVDTCCR